MRLKATQQKILKTIVVVIVKYFILLLWSCPKRWLSQSAALSDVAQSHQAGGPLLPLLIYWVISRGIFLQERSSIVCAGPKSIPHYGVSRREMASRGKEKREIASIPSSRFWRRRQGGSYGEAAEREEVSEERRWLREGGKKITCWGCNTERREGRRGCLRANEGEKFMQHVVDVLMDARLSLFFLIETNQFHWQQTCYITVQAKRHRLSVDSFKSHCRAHSHADKRVDNHARTRLLFITVNDGRRRGSLRPAAGDYGSTVASAISVFCVLEDGGADDTQRGSA